MKAVTRLSRHAFAGQNYSHDMLMCLLIDRTWICENNDGGMMHMQVNKCLTLLHPTQALQQDAVAMCTHVTRTHTVSCLISMCKGTPAPHSADTSAHIRSRTHYYKLWKARIKAVLRQERDNVVTSMQDSSLSAT